MEMKKRVAPLRVRKVKKENTESRTSSDSGIWVLEGEGSGYPPKISTDSNYPQNSEEEGVKEAHPHDKTHSNNTPMIMIVPMNPCQEKKHPSPITLNLT